MAFCDVCKGVLFSPTAFFRKRLKEERSAGLSKPFGATVAMSAVVIIVAYAIMELLVRFGGQSLEKVTYSVSWVGIGNLNLPHLTSVAALPAVLITLAFAYGLWLVYGLAAALVIAVVMRILGAHWNYQRAYTLWVYTAIPWMLLVWIIAMPIISIATPTISSPFQLLSNLSVLFGNPLAIIGWAVWIIAWFYEFIVTIIATRELYGYNTATSTLIWVGMKVLGLVVVQVVFSSIMSLVPMV
jgi:hypothetical protein